MKTSDYATVRARVVDDRPETHLEGWIACPSCGRSTRWEAYDVWTLKGEEWGIGHCSNPSDGDGCDTTFAVCVTFQVRVQAVALPPF